jgi:polygalacturonase
MSKLWKATVGACFLGLTALSCSARTGVPGGGATGDPRNITAAPPVPAVCATVTSTRVSPAAETAGSPLDTSRIQDALNQCGSGNGVKLSGGAFLTGPLILPSGVSLILDQGAVLYASRQAAAYDDPRKAGMGHCGQYDDFGKSCQPLITISNSSSAGIFGPGVIDGQGGQPILYPADWGPPAPCTSAAQMPAGFPHTMSWWDLSNCADVVRLNKLAEGKSNQNIPALIRASGRELSFSGFTMQNAPRAHLQVADSGNVTIWGLTINTPSDFADYGFARAHNTDGVDLINVTDATLSHSVINAGDDYVAIAAKANSKAGSSANITVSDDRFYGGHGVSIGSMISGGIRNILVEDIVIDGGPNDAAMNGIHIKSNGGAGGYVEDATFRHLCIRNALNAILVETHYAHQAGGAPIHYSGISFDDVSIFNQTPRTGRVIFDGSAASAPIEASLRDVVIDDPSAAEASQSSNTSFSLAGKLNFTPKGAGVILDRSGSQPDEGAKPSATCATELAQPAPFAISRQLKTKTP